MENNIKTILYSAEKRDKGMFFLLPLYEKEADEILIKASEYDADICDSDIVAVSFDGDGKIISVAMDIEETEKRKTEMKRRLSSLFDN